jgi:hypothetical protein
MVTMGEIQCAERIVGAHRKRQIRSVEDVRQFAAEWGQRNGFRGRANPASWHGAATVSAVVLDAEINHGRWLARCPCGDAPACDPAIPEAVCLGCGTIYPIRFPKQKDRDDIERALAGRPAAVTNWQPGETAQWLLSENLLHGDPAQLAAQIREGVI